MSAVAPTAVFAGNRHSSKPTTTTSLITRRPPSDYRPTLHPSSSSSTTTATTQFQLMNDLSQIDELSTSRRSVLEALSLGLFAGCWLCPAGDAVATRIEYYATVASPSCDMNFVRSGLGYCDLIVGDGVEPPRGELINVHYTARFADGIVFDSSYKRGRPLTMRIGVGKVIRGLDQGILGGGGVPPMISGGRRNLQIPPQLVYGSEPAGCFSGDCNIPANATLLYDVEFVGIYKRDF